MLRYIDTLKAFRSKYRFVPVLGMIQEYMRIATRADKAGNYTLAVIATCHAMRLGYNING